MKSLIFPLLVILICTQNFLMQELPHYLDKLEIPQNQRVALPASRPIDERRTPSPAVIPRQVKRTAFVTMTVYDGYAQRNTDTVTVDAPILTMTRKQLSGHSTGNPLIDSYIVDSSRRYNIDPLLIFAQMAQESSFKPRATSNKGARGLMQLMPATARRMGVTDIYDPKQNIEGGVKYMRLLLNLFQGDLRLALAGYNAGELAVIKYGYEIPPYNETQDYVRRISARYNVISKQASVSREQKSRPR